MFRIHYLHLFVFMLPGWIGTTRHAPSLERFWLWSRVDRTVFHMYIIGIILKTDEHPRSGCAEGA
jgi:hypothetical protein